MMWCASGGVDMNEKPISAVANLAQYQEIVDYLTKWRESCPTADGAAGE